MADSGDINYGAGSGGYEDTVRRMQANAAAQDELKRKESERASAEEKTAQVEQRAAKVRTGVAGATTELSAALTRNEAALRGELGAIEASTAALLRNLEVRRQVGAIGLAGPRVGGVASAASVSAAADVAEDPAAAGRLASAQRALAAAELARVQATAAARTGLTAKGATAEDTAPLIAQREEAAQAVRAARAQVQAAQAGVAAQEGLAAQQQAALAETARINTLLQEQRAATEAAVAATQREALAINASRVAQAGAVVSGVSAGAPAQRLLGPGAPPSAAPIIGNVVRSPAAAAGVAEIAGAAVAQDALARRAEASTGSIAALGAEQRRTTAAFQQASATYAESSTALSRHGALTTEFISAFARGQVTLAEFQSQMLATIGKFGGWTVAAGAVYGLYDALKHVKEGATETQAAILTLGRFLPGLGGPEGGGSSQIGPAITTVRNISTEFNVPISEVVGSMQVMARTFHNVADAGDATRAVLAAVRLDQVPAEDAQRYVTGISQSYGFTTLPAGAQGSAALGVIASLNMLQTQFAARVSETLPALARAAPVARAEGVSINELEAIVALGVRSGQTGNQVGTAITRSISSFAFRPQSELTFREKGITPQIGEYGKLFTDVTSLIDKRAASGKPLSGVELRDLAVALGGPQLGARSILPMLAQEQIHPGALQAGITAAEHPRPIQEDLSQVLGSIAERFKAIGIALQNFGSILSEAGVTAPLTALVDTISVLARGLETMAQPLASVGSEFQRLPSIVKDAVGAFIAFRAGTALYNTSFGSSALGFIGRLPGIPNLQASAAPGVQGTVGRLDTYLIPDARTNVEQTQRRLMQSLGAKGDAQAELLRWEQANAASDTGSAGKAYATTPEAPAAIYEEGYATRSNASLAAGEAAQAAQVKATAAQEALAKLLADKALLTDSSLSFADRALHLEMRGYAVQEEIVGVQEGILDAYRLQLKAAMDSGAKLGTLGVREPVGSPGAAAVDTAAIGATAVITAAAIAKDPATMGTIQQSVASARESGAPTVFRDPATGQFRSLRNPTPVGPFAPPTGPGEPAPVAGPSLVAAVPAAVREAVSGAASQIAGPQIVASIQRRVSQVSSAAEQAGGYGALALSQLRGAASSPAAPFAAVLGTQLLGGAVPGVAGKLITGIGGDAATGAVIAQMLGRSTGYGVAAGAALGAAQTGGAAGAIGAGVGGLVGAVAGLGLGDALTVPAGVAIGTLAGGTIGSILGGKPSAAAATDQAARNAKDAVALAQANESGMQKFADQTVDDMKTAFEGTGGSATAAQQKISSIIQRLTAELQIFGTASKQGQAARQALDAVVSAALGEAGQNPQAAQQALQAATTPRQAAVQQNFQYQLSQATTATGGESAATAAARQYNATLEPYSKLVTEKLDDQKAAQSYLAQTLANKPHDAAAIASAEAAAKAATAGLQKSLGGSDRDVADAIAAAKKALAAVTDAKSSKSNPAALKNAQQQLSDANDAVTAAKNIQTIGQEAVVLQNQANASTAYSKVIGISDAAGTLAVSRAGGNQAAQLAAQLANAKRDLATTQSFPGLASDERTQKTQAEQAQVADVLNKQAVLGLTELASKGKVAVSNVALGDPVGTANAQLQALRDQYKYVKDHAHAFDPSQLADLAAQVLDAKKAAVQAAADFATTMSDIQTNMAQAEDYGNRVKQAADQIAGARRDLSFAKTPQARAQANVNLLNAQNSAHEANQQQIQEQGTLAAAQNQGDPAAVAASNLAYAKSTLRSAKGYDEITAAQTAVINAQYAYDQAQVSAIQAQAGVAEAQAQGNPVLVAQIALSAARQELASAVGLTAQQNAQKDLANAQYQYAQALQATYTSQAELAASETVDPLQKLRDQIAGAQKSLGVARGPENQRTAQTTLNNLKTQYEQAAIDQRESTTQFNLSMMNISAAQALQQLQDLLHMKGLTTAKRQEIEQQIRQIQLGQYSTIGGGPGSFDLSPGNIPMPTPYDVGRAMKSGVGMPNANARHTITAATQINVYVKNSEDVPKVADAIERTTSGHLRARMRAAGMRGM